MASRSILKERTKRQPRPKTRERHGRTLLLRAENAQKPDRGCALPQKRYPFRVRPYSLIQTKPLAYQSSPPIFPTTQTGQSRSLRPLSDQPLEHVLWTGVSRRLPVACPLFASSAKSAVFRCRKSCLLACYLLVYRSSIGGCHFRPSALSQLG